MVALTQPELSIVVLIHDMVREAPRTLLSLSARYQGVSPDRYEVIVVENGSRNVLGEAAVRRHGENFRYEFIADPSPSPAAAMNHGATLASGRWLGLVIDGARIVTPGVIGLVLEIMGREQPTVVETLGFHLGHDVQPRSVSSGYDSDTEDRLLAAIDWPADGYRLFEIGTLAGSSRRGWLAPVSESNALFLAIDVFARHGGFDARFDEPGGGLVNLDLYGRLAEDTGLDFVRLLGEGTFHQVHGGAATGLHPWVLTMKWRQWARQYRRIRGRRYRSPDRLPSSFARIGPDRHVSLTTFAELARDRRPEV